MKRHTSAAGGKRCPPMAFESGQTCNETRFHADASRRKYFCSQYDWIIRHASTMRALWKTTICDAARGGAASPQYFRTILFLEESAQNDRAFPSGNGRRWLRPACRGKQDMPLPTPKYKPTFVPLMTPSPALDGIWPPPGNRGPYRVGRDPSINWKILAWSWGLTDVWDLIWFQFVTDDPREVNWYMHYYLGCWKSNDGKNSALRTRTRASSIFRRSATRVRLRWWPARSAPRSPISPMSPTSTFTSTGRTFWPSSVISAHVASRSGS